MYVSNGIKISEQPLTINDGIPSKPAHLECFRSFIALLTAAAETGAAGKKSVVRDCGALTVGQRVDNGLKVISKGISNILRLSDKLVIRFNLSKTVIFPSEIRNIFPKLLRLSVIDRL
jgi:hypothetical protein